MSKKVLIAFPDDMLDEIDRLATEEYRTRSEFMREAARRYIQEANRKRSTTNYVPSNYESRQASTELPS